MLISDLKCLEFSDLQQNTYHSIEAVFDLMNLNYGLDYLTAMKHCYNRNKQYNLNTVPYSLIEGVDIYNNPFSLKHLIM